jgi:predicted DNA-binding antitoxin AbrB/MazE fold protein
MQENYRGKIKPTKKIRFKIGDHVRIAIYQPKFGRGYDKKSKEEIYKIVEVITKFPRVLYRIASLAQCSRTVVTWQQKLKEAYH